ncbi:hypothetical protein [Endozoicomonas lisbonensis]|uniref:ABC-type transporter Mla subunit MlaD n=1 Tax=Endozoicomonas lisbonensis TaxID=3120522 RepID=A0ABV2SK78_9GAMM
MDPVRSIPLSYQSQPGNTQIPAFDEVTETPPYVLLECDEPPATPLSERSVSSEPVGQPSIESRGGLLPHFSNYSNQGTLGEAIELPHRNISSGLQTTSTQPEEGSTSNLFEQPLQQGEYLQQNQNPGQPVMDGEVAQLQTFNQTVFNYLQMLTAYFATRPPDDEGLVNRIMILTSYLNRAVMERDNLINSISQSESTIKELQEMLQDKQRELIEASMESDKVKQEVQLLQQQKALQETANEQLTNEFNKVQEARKKQEEYTENLNGRIKELNETIENKHVLLSEKNEVIRAMEMRKMDIQRYQQEVKEVKEKLTEQQNEFSEKESQWAKEKKSIYQLLLSKDQKITDTVSSHSEIKDRLDEIKSQLRTGFDELIHARSQAEKQKQDFENEVVRLRAEHDKEKGELTAENESLYQTINVLKLSIAQNEQSNREIEVILNKEIQINNFESKLSAMEQQLDESNSRHADIVGQLDTTKAQLVQTSQSLDKVSADSKTLFEDNQQLNAELEKETSEKINLKNELEKQLAEVDRLKTELSEQQASILSLEEQLNRQPTQVFDFVTLSASAGHLIDPVSGECSSEPVSSGTASPTIAESVSAKAGVITDEPVASTSQTVPVSGAPQNLEELFQRAEQLKIPQEYVALGYPIRKQNNGHSVTIRSKEDLGDPSKFESDKEREILNEIARVFCNGDTDLVDNYWHQASFLEYFYKCKLVTSWRSLSHFDFCRKMAGVRSLGIDKTDPDAEGIDAEGINVYSKKEVDQLTVWRNEQNYDEDIKGFSPKGWQPWVWLSTLAKAHRENSEDKLMLLAGLWADFSFLMAPKSLRKAAKARIQQNKDPFDWRKLSDTSEEMAIASGGQGETVGMASKGKRKVPMGKSASAKKQRQK